MVVVGTGGSGSRFLKRNWPITRGLEAGTTKQEGDIESLIPQVDLIPETEKVGID